MKSSNIGGQAVLEGVMMKNGDQYAVAVRKPDGEIALQKEVYDGIVKWKKLTKIPFVRGIFSFVDSLVLGMKTLSYSASFFEEEEEEELTEKEAAKKDMGRMLDYIDKLSELDTTGVEPMSHVFPVQNVFREDVVTNGDESEQTLANAPGEKDNMFVVPKTFD